MNLPSETSSLTVMFQKFFSFCSRNEILPAFFVHGVFLPCFCRRMSCPSMKMFPCVQRLSGIMPAISERSVDFPLPFMPHKAVMEFSGSEKFKFEKTGVSWNEAERF